MKSKEDINEILFTTHDGVGIKNDDKYYVVWTEPDALFYMDLSGCDGGWLADENTISDFEDDKYKLFSTKEKALEFIYWNKIHFSLEDMRKCYEQAAEDHTGNYSTGTFDGYVEKLNL